MKFTELVKHLAQTENNEAQVRRVLNNLQETIIEETGKGNDVALSQLGRFTTTNRKARTGRNPRTGDPILIAAKTVPVFKPGKALKDAANQNN